jgi:hypothetical protein
LEIATAPKGRLQWHQGSRARFPNEPLWIAKASIPYKKAAERLKTASIIKKIEKERGRFAPFFYGMLFINSKP